MKFTRLIIAGLILSMGVAQAQKGVEDGSKFGHGQDSIDCVKNLSLYDEYYKQGNYADALPYWKIVFQDCPLSTSNIYIHGVKMMKALISKDKANKEEHYQMLMQVYDQRIKYFGNSPRTPESYIIGAKAIDMLKYKRKDQAVVKEAYELLKKSINDRGVKSQTAVAITYMTTTISLYKIDHLDAETVVNNYTTVSNILDKHISVAKPQVVAKLKEYKSGIDTEFAKSGAADCEILEKIFGPQLADHTTDLEWLKRINRLLARSECVEADLFYKSSEFLHKIEPSASSAYGLFKMHLKTQNMDKAFTYINEAIELEEEAEDKAKYYYQLGLINMSQNSFADAKKAANKAIGLKANYGEAYMLIGKAYAAAAKSYGADEFAHSTVYWAAVDKFIKAKKVDPSVADAANELIRVYSAHFPPKDEIFFRPEVTEGGTYKLGSWINETTTVRAK